MNALLRKSWLESRGRFYCGLGGALLVSGGMTALYHFSGTTGNTPASVENYGRFVSGKWFGTALAAYGPLFALVMSGSGIVSQRTVVSTRGFAGTGWALSLPVRRWKLCGSRALVGAAELAVLLLVAALLVPAVSALAGQSYALRAALCLAAQNFSASFVFFGLAVLLAALLDDFWHEIAGYGILTAGFVTRPAPALAWARVLRGDTFLEQGAVASAQVAICIAAGLGLAAVALWVVEHREY